MPIRAQAWSLAICALAALPVVAQAPASGTAEPPSNSDLGPEEGARIERLEVFDRIEADGRFSRRQFQVTLLRDAAAVAAYSQVGVPFLEANQEAELTRLSVTKPDGRELDLLATAPRDVAPVHPPNLPIHSDLRLLRAAVPSLEVGDRLAFETVVRAQPLVERGAWTEMKFLEEAGAQLYELDAPEALPLRLHVRSGLVAETSEERRDGRVVRRWTIRGAVEGSTPAPGPDPDASEDGFEPDVASTTFQSWEEFVDWWGGLAPPEVDDTVRAKAAELTAGAAGAREKLRAIHRYVAQQVRYLALPLGIGRYRARPPAEVIRTGLGDCKDKIRLIASLAQSAGIAVEPVLVGVERRKRLDDAPSPDQFDHVVARARLDGADFWMDPTSEMTPMGRLPAPIRDLPGVALTGGPKAVRPELVTTPAKLPLDTVIAIDTTGSIEPAGTIRARVRWTFEGDDEIQRLAFRYGTTENQRQIVEFLGRAWTRKDKGKVVSVKSGDPRDLETPFWIEYDVEWPMSASTWAKDWDFWVPLPEIELDEPPEEGDSAAGKPLELAAARRQRVTARFELPEGVAISPPVPFDSKRELANYRSTYAVEGRTLSVERELVVKVDTVAPAQFADLRSLRKLIDDDDSQEFDIAAAPSIAPPTAETATALSDRCWEELEANRYAAAEKLCRRALELDPKLANAWYRLGNASYYQGRPEEAGDAYRKVVELEPDHGWATAGLGRLAWARGDRREAERLLRKQIELAPLEPYAYSQLGYFLLQENKPEEAEAMYALALRLDPEDESTLEELAFTRVLLGRCEEALARMAARPEAPSDLEDRVRLAGTVVSSECAPLAPTAAFFDRLRGELEKSLEKVDLGNPQSIPLVNVPALAMAWEATGRIAAERSDAERSKAYFEAATAVQPNAWLVARRADELRAQGDGDGADYHLALAASLPGRRQANHQARLEAAIPSEGRRTAYASRAREESWKLRGLSIEVPAAAGVQGNLWLLFAADGRLLDVRSSDFGAVEPLVKALQASPPTLPLPPGNRAQIPRRANAYCSAAGACTLMFEAGHETAWALKQP